MQIKKGLNSFLNKLKTNQQWLGFIVVVLALLYAYIQVLFESKHIGLDIIYAVLFIFMIYGLYHSYNIEREKRKTIQLFNLDSLFVIIGVFSTYTLVHLLDISVVLASSFIGLLVHFLIKKYEVPIYCGSFAGMVSVAIFGFFEVSILALVCIIIYALISPLFTGYGGKLGTIAFISSLIVHSIFFDEFAVSNTDLHFVVLMITTILGVVLTFYLQHLAKTTSVFASAATSFLFAILFIYIIPSYSQYAIVFFSASFIGMSSKDRLPTVVLVILSGVILGLIYFFFVSLFNGLGGKLGLMAFISVIITMSTSRVYYLLKKKT